MYQKILHTRRWYRAGLASRAAMALFPVLVAATAGCSG